ncbi:hypothetical protein PM082_020293 [Marasmius tenuissimus]|nr:hypothetical protein PM082_020293 [Marasmius tenuissimus]
MMAVGLELGRNRPVPRRTRESEASLNSSSPFPQIHYTTPSMMIAHGHSDDPHNLTGHMPLNVISRWKHSPFIGLLNCSDSQPGGRDLYDRPTVKSAEGRS